MLEKLLSPVTNTLGFIGNTLDSATDGIPLLDTIGNVAGGILNAPRYGNTSYMRPNTNDAMGRIIEDAHDNRLPQSAGAAIASGPAYSSAGGTPTYVPNNDPRIFGSRSLGMLGQQIKPTINLLAKVGNIADSLDPYGRGDRGIFTGAQLLSPIMGDIGGIVHGVGDIFSNRPRTAAQAMRPQAGGTQAQGEGEDRFKDTTNLNAAAYLAGQENARNKRPATLTEAQKELESAVDDTHDSDGHSYQNEQIQSGIDPNTGMPFDVIQDSDVVPVISPNPDAVISPNPDAGEAQSAGRVSKQFLIDNAAGPAPDPEYPPFEQFDPISVAYDADFTPITNPDGTIATDENGTILVDPTSNPNFQNPEMDAEDLIAAASSGNPEQVEEAAMRAQELGGDEAEALVRAQAAESNPIGSGVSAPNMHVDTGGFDPSQFEQANPFYPSIDDPLAPEPVMSEEELDRYIDTAGQPTVAPPETINPSYNPEQLPMPSIDPFASNADQAPPIDQELLDDVLNDVRMAEELEGTMDNVDARLQNPTQMYPSDQLPPQAMAPFPTDYESPIPQTEINPVATEISNPFQPILTGEAQSGPIGAYTGADADIGTLLNTVNSLTEQSQAALAQGDIERAIHYEAQLQRFQAELEALRAMEGQQDLPAVPDIDRSMSF
jgi:hypothetical protein